MYVTAVPNRGKAPTVLLRESYREGGKVKNRTLANLKHLPSHAVEALRRALRGEALVAADEAIEILSSVQHGHVQAVLTAFRRLGLDALIDKSDSPNRTLVLAMIAARILAPASKLATTRWWRGTSLPSELGVEDATEDDLYAAMDWLVEQQPAIERRLAKRHLKPGGRVLYDLTSTWVEGRMCPLAARGYSRDGRHNSLQINFGLMTDDVGRPVAVTVYPGNTADSQTVADQLDQLQHDFAIEDVVFVGDRGMVTQTQIDEFVARGGIDWITALKSGAIQKLEKDGALQLGLFDERNLFELTSPRYPGERLVACRNADLAARRAHKRAELIEATKAELDKVKGMVRRGRLVEASEIGLRAGRVRYDQKLWIGCMKKAAYPSV